MDASCFTPSRRGPLFASKGNVFFKRRSDCGNLLWFDQILGTWSRNWKGIVSKRCDLWLGFATCNAISFAAIDSWKFSSEVL